MTEENQMSNPNTPEPIMPFGVTTADMDALARGQAHQALDARVVYYPPSEDAVAAHAAMRAAVAVLGHRAIEACPNSPELREALRTLTDEVLAGFNAAIARNHDRLRPAAELVDHPAVWVVASDYGLNGHEVHGVYASGPSDEAVAAAANRVSGVAGYGGTEVSTFIVEASAPVTAE